MVRTNSVRLIAKMADQAAGPPQTFSRVLNAEDQLAEIDLRLGRMKIDRTKNDV